MMTLTWRTVRDYALRFATYIAVTLAAVSIPMAPLAGAIYLMRFYWLAFTVSHADVVAVTVLAVWLVLMFLLVWVGHRWRKNWLWRRWRIDVGH